ncbi:MAG: hypothetical protein AAF479_13945, partial [Pseudomonadota bacterium]
GDGRSDDPNASDVDDTAAPISVSLGLVSIDVQATDVFSVGAEETVSDVDAGQFAPNVGPDAQDDAFIVAEEVLLTANLFEDNGNGPDIDPDGDPLKIIEANGVATNQGSQITSADGRVGNVFVGESGSLNFAFDQVGAFVDLIDGETDTISFDYTITDGNGETDVANVSVVIEGSGGATVQGTIPNTGPGDRNIAIILDASLPSVGTANAFTVPDYDNDTNVGTVMDEQLSKVIDLAATLADTDQISLIPSGFNGFSGDIDSAIVTFSAGELNAVAGDLAGQQALFNPIVDSFNGFDFTLDFEQSFGVADALFQSSVGFEQNKVIAMVATEATVDQGGTPLFLTANVEGAFSDLTTGPSAADVDVLVIDDSFAVPANLAAIDSDGMVDVDNGTMFGLDTFVDPAPTVASAADLVSFEVSVDGVADADIDLSDLTPTADGFEFTPTLFRTGEVEATIGLDTDSDGVADIFRSQTDTLLDGETFDFTLDAFVSDQLI